MRAVLFDLDGTLLDIDIDAFLERYFAALGPVMAEVTGTDPRPGLKAVLAATDAMCRPHANRTNQSVFAEHFTHATGVELGDAEWARFARFYAEEFPALGDGMGPREGARAAVQTALDLGVRVAIATNPIFPREAVYERMRWAQVDDLDVDLVTTYERMTSCKPAGAYFLETAAILDVDPRDCLMVGDDPSLDMPAADVGMRTFYVGTRPAPSADWAGSLTDLAELMPKLVEGVDAD